MSLPPVAAHDTQFFLLVEKGALEAQAVLLCRSIRRFAGAYSKSPISVISPRANRRPCRETCRRLARLDAEYLELNLESPCPTYGPSLRVLAAARMEERSGAAIVVQLDSDTIFLGEPDFSLAGVHAAARPVDVKGVSTEGAEDPFDAYWLSLCEMLGVNYETLPWIESTVDRKRVRANYNGGLVAVRRAAGLLQQTEDFFLRLAAANRRPWGDSTALVKSGVGPVDHTGSQYWGSSQIAFALAVAARGGIVQVLPRSYNVPLHSFDSLPLFDRMPVHVHYHWLGSPEECIHNPLLDGRLRLDEEAASWLAREFPLRPPRSAVFERLFRFRAPGS